MNAGRYRKKPVVIDAVQWDGTEAGLRPVFDLIGDFAKLPNNDGYVRPGVGYTPALGTLDIPTLEGTMTASPGDWIVRGVKGECYPVKPDIFDATYEPEATGSAASEPTWCGCDDFIPRVAPSGSVCANCGHSVDMHEIRLMDDVDESPCREEVVDVTPAKCEHHSASLAGDINGTYWACDGCEMEVALTKRGPSADSASGEGSDRG